MLALIQLLAQIDDAKIRGDGTPPLDGVEYSYGLTWVLAALLVALTLLVTFKTSKRNAVERG